ncbi:nucleotide-diphospho-sugar transferase [Catenaria anguillulae PL171]|uniref:Translation initiation factor eIF2B subunit epsilon n=1 Tax=Catenaria anguillulae PL171 TaxID=765915 RepID=A0A1Y2HWT5_9FUNG|nr:nucleotide-diphospho-sugar transferase [Catenaria anguillulae PL171]
MAPAKDKNKNDHDHGKLEAGDDILQAVVVADSFDQRFMPLTADQPRCLLPLCNVPLIEYTLELLAVANVQEVFIVCCAHSDTIKQYLAASQWTDQSTSPIKVHVIVSRSSMSMGDVLRELDTKSLIKSDFILVNADVVSNLKLEPVLALHKERRAKDKNAIMTMVLKDGGSAFHAARGPHAMFCLDPNSSKCLQYLPLDRPDSHEVSLNPEVIAEHHDLVIRNDLIDCGIDICSIEVLALFSENFDYQDIRSDFVRGILESDLFVKSIYSHVIRDEYAVRVRNTQLYDRVSLDVMRRWTYPLVPDANALGSTIDPTNFSHSRGNVYREKPVYLSRTTSLVNNVVLGRNSTVGQGTVLANCVIGRDCKIGKNVRLSNTYLWDGCIIGDGVTAEYAIFAQGVTIKDGVAVGRGVIVGRDAVVGGGVQLQPFTRIAIDEDQDTDSNLVGSDGQGSLWIPEDEDDDDDDEQVDTQLRSMVHDLGWTQADLNHRIKHLALARALASDAGSDLESDGEEDTDEEIRATIQRALAQNHTIDNALLELNTLKFAYNLTFKDLRDGVVPCILQHVFITNTKNFKATLERWVAVWAGLVHGKEDEVDLLRAMTTWFDEQPERIVKYISTVAMVLYESDIVEDTSFLVWFRHPGSTISAAVRKAVEPFLGWLEEDSDEEEESDEEESDDE